MPFCDAPLAMGVDRALRVESAPADPFTVGKGLRSVAAHLEPDLILCGAQASDSAHGATGPVLAGLLGVPCVAVVKSIQVDARGNLADVARELETRVTDWLGVSLRAVLTVQIGINQPRHPNLRAIKQAEREAIQVVESRGTASAYRVRKLFHPVSRTRCQPLGADVREAAEVLARLIREAVV